MFRRLSHTLGHLRHRGDLESGPIPELDLEEIACLERDLEDLGSLVVPPAARERGWAVVQAQMARRTTGRAASSRRKAGARRLRIALAGALVVVAATLGAIGLVNLRDGREIASTQGSAVTTVAAGAVDTAPSAGTSLVTVTTLPEVSSPSATTLPVVNPGQPDGSLPGTSVTAENSRPTPGTGTMGVTTTTKPATTTSRQVMAKEEKERQALAVVGFLAQAVATGDRAKAQALVSEGAAFGLNGLLASARNPLSHSVALLGESSNTPEVRVLLEIIDRVPTDSGATEDVKLRFLCTVRTGEDGALITAIYAAP